MREQRRSGWTLADFVAHLWLSGRRVGTPEFDSLVKIYGMQKIEALVLRAEQGLVVPKNREREPGEDDE